MVQTERCQTIAAIARGIRAAGMAVMLSALCLGVADTLHAQQPGVHYLHHGVMPPGAIGGQQLQRGGPLLGYFQPVEIKVPSGALVSLAADNRFDQPQANSRQAGLLIAAVYRLRVTNIRAAEGVEVFPTIELIDRLYPPAQQQCRFAIPIDITDEDLKLAAAGKFVTRIIYVEDPRNAVPARENLQTQGWFDVAPGQDPLAVADGLGRPVAILRLGGRMPIQDQQPDPAFFYGSPKFVALASTPDPMPAPEATPADKPHDTNTSDKAAASQPKVINLAPPPQMPSAATSSHPGESS